MYKGVKIQSEDEKSEGSSSDSADDYFNQQRKMIRGKIVGSKT